ncbi:hypothetical protein FQZ97_1032850 [compost metagenome]
MCGTRWNARRVIVQAANDRKYHKRLRLDAMCASGVQNLRLHLGALLEAGWLCYRMADALEKRIRFLLIASEIPEQPFESFKLVSCGVMNASLG